MFKILVVASNTITQGGGVSMKTVKFNEREEAEEAVLAVTLKMAGRSNVWEVRYDVVRLYK